MKHKRTISAICKTDDAFIIKTRDSEYIWNGPLTAEDLDGEDEEWAACMMQTCDRILEWMDCGGSAECPAYISWSPYKKPMLCVDRPTPFRSRVQPSCRRDDPEWCSDPDGPGNLV